MCLYVGSNVHCIQFACHDSIEPPVFSTNSRAYRLYSIFLSHSVASCPVLNVSFCAAYGLLRRQVRWSGILISLRLFHSLLWSSQRLYCSQWSRSRCYFENFLNPACTSGSSQFMYSWSLAWRILSIILLACEVSATNSHFCINGWESKCVLTSILLIRWWLYKVDLPFFPAWLLYPEFNCFCSN